MSSKVVRRGITRVDKDERYRIVRDFDVERPDMHHAAVIAHVVGTDEETTRMYGVEHHQEEPWLWDDEVNTYRRDAYPIVPSPEPVGPTWGAPGSTGSFSVDNLGDFSDWGGVTYSWSGPNGEAFEGTSAPITYPDTLGTCAEWTVQAKSTDVINDSGETAVSPVVPIKVCAMSSAPPNIDNVVITGYPTYTMAGSKYTINFTGAVASSPFTYSVLDANGTTLSKSEGLLEGEDIDSLINTQHRSILTVRVSLNSDPLVYSDRVFIQPSQRPGVQLPDDDTVMFSGMTVGTDGRRELYKCATDTLGWTFTGADEYPLIKIMITSTTGMTTTKTAYSSTEQIFINADQSLEIGDIVSFNYRLLDVVSNDVTSWEGTVEFTLLRYVPTVDDFDISTFQNIKQGSDVYLNLIPVGDWKDNPCVNQMLWEVKGDQTITGSTFNFDHFHRRYSRLKEPYGVKDHITMNVYMPPSGNPYTAKVQLTMDPIGYNPGGGDVTIDVPVTFEDTGTSTFYSRDEMPTLPYTITVPSGTIRVRIGGGLNSLRDDIPSFPSTDVENYFPYQIKTSAAQSTVYSADIGQTEGLSNLPVFNQHNRGIYSSTLDPNNVWWFEGAYDNQPNNVHPVSYLAKKLAGWEPNSYIPGEVKFKGTANNNIYPVYRNNTNLFNSGSSQFVISTAWDTALWTYDADDEWWFMEDMWSADWIKIHMRKMENTVHGAGNSSPLTGSEALNYYPIQIESSLAPGVIFEADPTVGIGTDKQELPGEYSANRGIYKVSGDSSKGSWWVQLHYQWGDNDPYPTHWYMNKSTKYNNAEDKPAELERMRTPNAKYMIVHDSTGPTVGPTHPGYQADISIWNVNGYTFGGDDVIVYLEDSFGEDWILLHMRMHLVKEQGKRTVVELNHSPWVTVPGALYPDEDKPILEVTGEYNNFTVTEMGLGGFIEILS